MKILLAIIGSLLVVSAFVYLHYLLPLGCAMNTTGCRQTFGYFSAPALAGFWPPVLAGGALLGWVAFRKPR